MYHYAVSSNLVGEKAYLGLPKGKLGVNDTEFATTEAKQKSLKILNYLEHLLIK